MDCAAFLFDCHNAMLYDRVMHSKELMDRMDSQERARGNAVEWEDLIPLIKNHEIHPAHTHGYLSSAAAVAIMTHGGYAMNEDIRLSSISPDVIDEVDKLARPFSHSKTGASRHDRVLTWEARGVLVILGSCISHMNLQIMYDSRRHDLANKILNVFKAGEVKQERKVGDVRALFQTSEGLETRSILTVKDPLDRRNYSQDVLAGFDMIKDKMLAEQMPTRGRLALFDGPAGTGKTHLIRGLIEACPHCLFLFVPPSTISQMTGPGFTGVLKSIREGSSQPIVLVVEDAEQALSQRSSDNIESINALLNMTDGLFGEAFDIRMVATTNIRNAEVDKAVKRKGRMFATVQVGPLDPEQATQVLRRLRGDETSVVSKPTTLGDLYAMSEDSHG